MPILHRRILPCLAPSCCCRWRPPRWPSRRRRPGARGRAGQPHHLGRHAGRAGPHPRTGAGALSPGPTAPRPGAALPPEVQRRIDALPISRQSDEDAQAEQRRLRQDARTRRPTPGSGQRDARVIARDRADATADRAVWRALYSPNQLQEQMTWFWMNHFNVYAPRATWAPSSAAMKTAPSGRTRWQVPRPAGRDHPLAGHAAVPGQRAERGRQDQRELCARADGAAHAGRERRLYADGRRSWRASSPAWASPARRAARCGPSCARRWCRTGCSCSIRRATTTATSSSWATASPAPAWQKSTRPWTCWRAIRPPPISSAPSWRPISWATRRRPRWSTGWPHLPGQRRRHRRRAADAVRLARIRAFAGRRRVQDPVHYVYSSLRLAYAGMPTIVNPRPALNLLRQLGQPLNQRLTPDGYRWRNRTGPAPDDARFETARAIAAAPPNFYRDPPRTRSSSSSSSSSRRRSRPRRACLTCSRLCRHRAVRPVVARHARRWRRPPPRRQYLPAGLAGIHAALVPPHTAPSARRSHAPSPPAPTHGRRPSRWAPAASTPRRRGQPAAGRFMRGAYDAASLLVPAASDFYYESRPTIAIRARQRRRRRAAAGRRLALHPALAASLMPFYQRASCLPALRRHRGHQPQPLRDAEPHRAGTGAGQGRRRLRLGLSEPAGGRAGRCADRPPPSPSTCRRSAGARPTCPTWTWAAPAASRG